MYSFHHEQKGLRNEGIINEQKERDSQTPFQRPFDAGD